MDDRANVGAGRHGHSEGKGGRWRRFLAVLRRGYTCRVPIRGIQCLSASHGTHPREQGLVVVGHVRRRRCVCVRRGRVPLNEFQLVNAHVARLNGPRKGYAFARVFKQALSVHTQRTVQRWKLLDLPTK